MPISYINFIALFCFVCDQTLDGFMPGAVSLAISPYYWHDSTLVAIYYLTRGIVAGKYIRKLSEIPRRHDRFTQYLP